MELSNNVKVEINQDKINEDQKWDGLKGYITNTTLPAKKVYEQYNGLWVIERAYRITKETLEMLPMFHFNPKRIEAHICICFVAYKVYKELERILKVRNINLSVDKVLDIAYPFGQRHPSGIFFSVFQQTAAVRGACWQGNPTIW